MPMETSSFPRASRHCATRFTIPDHRKNERFLALVMLAIIPASFIFDSPLMNYILALSLAVHAYWGLLMS